jgi:membrane protease YdiL (CAAX protease family)
MQGPIETRAGLPVAILITGTMFAVAHLDFTPILWPYYVAVAALYGVVTYLADSTWPAVVLHTSGNVYSNVDLLLHGRAEWQAPASAAGLVWSRGADRSFVWLLTALLVSSAATVWACVRLAAAARRKREER